MPANYDSQKSFLGWISRMHIRNLCVARGSKLPHQAIEIPPSEAVGEDHDQFLLQAPELEPAKLSIVDGIRYSPRFCRHCASMFLSEIEMQ